MSKLSKLFADPRLFLEDAASNARVRARLVWLGVAGDGWKPGQVEQVDAASPWLAMLLARTRNSDDVFLTTGPGGEDELNCFVPALPLLLEHALSLASGAGARLRVGIGGHTSAVTRRDLGAISGRLLAAKQIDLGLVTGDREQSVRVLVWERREREGQCVCRAVNLFAKKVPMEMFASVFDRATRRVHLERLYERPIHATCSFDVDFVYTWVNHEDPAWRELIGRFRALDAVDWDRYHSVDELRYSLRSVHEHAPWARQIFVVTNCARPAWLVDHPKVRWVTHEEVFPASAECLPTFNSHAIESCLMRLDGLSEHFVYMNDDVFLGRPCSKQDFFAPNGVSLSYFEPSGMVLGEVSTEKPDFINAAINCRKLIEDSFGVSPTQLHEHAPHALRRSVLVEMEERYAGDFDRVRRARFRASTDVSTVSFLYHHYAFQKREAQIAPTMSIPLVRPSNYATVFAQMLAGRREPFFCINDGGESAGNAAFQASTRAFLASYFPRSAPWELNGAGEG